MTLMVGAPTTSHSSAPPLPRATTSSSPSSTSQHDLSRAGVSTTYTADSSNFVDSPTIASMRTPADGRTIVGRTTAAAWALPVSAPKARRAAGRHHLHGPGLSGAGTTQTLNTLIYDFPAAASTTTATMRWRTPRANRGAGGADIQQAIRAVRHHAGTQSALTLNIATATRRRWATWASSTSCLPAVDSQQPAAVVSGCGGASVNINYPRDDHRHRCDRGANGSCTISIPVTAAAAGTYVNTTQALSSTARAPD